MSEMNRAPRSTDFFYDGQWYTREEWLKKQVEKLIEEHEKQIQEHSRCIAQLRRRLIWLRMRVLLFAAGGVGLGLLITPLAGRKW
jgi:hypothetical protein